MAGTPGRSGGANRKSGGMRSRDRRDRRSKGPPEACTRPARPAWLVDEIAVDAWQRIVELLEARGTITAADADAVLLAAVAESEYRKADAAIGAAGLVAAGRHGPIAHPLIKVRADAWKRWSAALSRLGLDPITRGRVEPPRSPPKGNLFEKI